MFKTKNYNFIELNFTNFLNLTYLILLYSFLIYVNGLCIYFSFLSLLNFYFTCERDSLISALPNLKSIDGDLLMDSDESDDELDEIFNDEGMIY